MIRTEIAAEHRKYPGVQDFSFRSRICLTSVGFALRLFNFVAWPLTKMGVPALPEEQNPQPRMTVSGNVRT
jgi:hypothetical protein